MIESLERETPVVMCPGARLLRKGARERQVTVKEQVNWITVKYRSAGKL